MLRMSSCKGQKRHQCEAQFQCPFLWVSRQEGKRTSTVQEAISDRPSLPWVLLLCTLNFSVGKRASLSSEIISSSNLHFPANGLVYSCWIVNGKSCMNQVYGIFPTVDKKGGIPLGKRCVCGGGRSVTGNIKTCSPFCRNHSVPRRHWPPWLEHKKTQAAGKGKPQLRQVLFSTAHINRGSVMKGHYLI